VSTNRRLDLGVKGLMHARHTRRPADRGLRSEPLPFGGLAIFAALSFCAGSASFALILSVCRCKGLPTSSLPAVEIRRAPLLARACCRWFNE
jgi:hypothetical protein